MKAFRFSIVVILFFLTACAFDLTKVYAAEESNLSQNCGIYGQTDKNLILADSGMERVFLEDFSLLSKVLIWVGIILLIVIAIKIRKKIHNSSGKALVGK